MRLTLRAKLVLVALVLAVIPAVGYVHVKQMEALLRDGQEQALLATARAIATALHDRPQLLELRAGQPASGEMELLSIEVVPPCVLSDKTTEVLMSICPLMTVVIVVTFLTVLLV